MFPKDQVVRIVAGPEGPVIDYREKLPGRAAYLCARRECVERALSARALSRALKMKMEPPDAGMFLDRLAREARAKIVSLLTMAAKAGMLASGYSAVLDAVRKGRAELLLFAEDISAGTRGKIEGEAGAASLRSITALTKDEIGPLFGRETAGVCAVLEKGFACAIWSEWERVNNLRTAHE